MIGKNQQKLIRSLGQKKYRQQNNLFVAEGPKTVCDIMSVIPPKSIIATQEWIDSSQPMHGIPVTCVTADELRKISFLQHPQQVMALFPLPSQTESYDAGSELLLALDGIQDPGNLGTIIRLADWFGIKNILCSHATADAFSPKVIQATMGSIIRVNMIYCDLEQTLRQITNNGIPVYGTMLDGNNIYKEHLCANGVVVMGNEGNGISGTISPLVTQKLLIPAFTKNDDHAESLNVAIATAITLSEFRRR